MLSEMLTRIGEALAVTTAEEEAAAAGESAALNLSSALMLLLRLIAIEGCEGLSKD